MNQLLSLGFDDLVGLMLRALLESWYLGWYLYLDADEAMTVLYENHAYQLSHLDESWGVAATVFDEFWDGKQISHNWKKISDRVDELAREKGASSSVGERTYAVLYRGTSLMNVHGGLGTIGSHVVQANDGSLSLALRSARPGEGEVLVITGGGLVGTLAFVVASQFGLAVDEIGRLNQLLGWESPAATG
jgi:hypothetical protein